VKLACHVQALLQKSAPSEPALPSAHTERQRRR
jgi:hypothetical protein